MSSISFTQITDGSTIDASDVNTPLNTIYDDYNGGIDSNNLADNAVTTAKITDANVTASKLATDAVETAKIKNAQVTADKLATGAASSYVATSETTTSTSYAGLTTPQTVTATIGANGLALVVISAECSNSNAEVSVWASFALSGANTVASSDANGFTSRQTTATAVTQVGKTVLLTGLTAGSTVFTMQFKTIANTATFSQRRISVVPL